MDEHIVDGVAILADGYGLEAETVLNQTAVHILAENHLLAMHEVDGAVGAMLTVGDIVVDSVVENHAVLQNLNHRAALVLGSCHHHLLADVQFHVQAAGKEGATGAKRQLSGHEGVLGRAIGRRLGLETACTGGRELALSQTVDAVVEQQQVEVDIAAHLVDEVVTADGKAVTVARNLPNGHVGVGGLETRCHSTATAMDGVEGVGAGVIRQT